ncbi:molybdopterin-guanine dinucleotide biosynthesis protein [Cryobacterium glaciale]|uniref:Molybdopterin-guanine dinucleotide biosynthesis protein n=1 Tax=Cryobacterium glaciale TaxID=1259145 RepID=A0A4R8V668_9MICO|nr:molybdopterin-guanine dinucleotide biosynthesis protein [Cryobacterium glaciale]
MIVLAGGRGSRLGGALKPAIEVAGRTLLSRVLDTRPLARHVVVVGPPAARPAAGDRAGAALIWALEDPPFGGPVAGIAAGLAALKAHGEANADIPADWLLVLACDLPWGADAARLLVVAASALETTSGPETGSAPTVDGVHLVDSTGHAQWLAAIYRAPALRAAVHRLGDRVNGASMRDLLAGLNLDGLSDESETGTDVDTWQDVESSSERLIRSKPTEE